MGGWCAHLVRVGLLVKIFKKASPREDSEWRTTAGLVRELGDRRGVRSRGACAGVLTSPEARGACVGMRASRSHDALDTRCRPCGRPFVGLVTQSAFSICE